MNIQQLQQQHDQAQVRAKGLLDRASNPMTASERGFIQTAVDEVASLRSRLVAAKGDANFSAAIAGAVSGMDSPSHFGGGVGSFGEQFLKSETFNWLAKHRGQLPSGQWTSPSSELAATVLDSTGNSGGDLIVTQYVPGVSPLPQRPLVVAALFAQGQTDSASVTYMKETTFTNAAAAVGEGAVKPESTMIFDQVVDLVVKLAHWLPVTDEMLEDVQQIASYIDTRLRLGLNLAEEVQLLSGSGVAPNMTGLLNRSGLATPVVRSGSTTNSDAILTQISTVEYATALPVDGIIMNPLNWLTILLAKDGDGNYVGSGGPFASPRRPTLWGRNVALTSAIALGTALVGSFQGAATLWHRGGVRVEVSNSHQDFFVRNLTAIRCEERLALSVYRAGAFGTVTSLT
jgi:HK97 family phage major capsid protein